MGVRHAPIRSRRRTKEMVLTMTHRNEIQARRKLANCIIFARECSRDSWQVLGMAKEHRKEMRLISREAIEDARYWRAQL